MQGPSSSQWRPVCVVVQEDGKVDAAGIKQWLQAQHSLKRLDLSEQGFTDATGPIGDSVAAAKEVLLRQNVGTHARLLKQPAQEAAFAGCSQGGDWVCAITCCESCSSPESLSLRQS